MQLGWLTPPCPRRERIGGIACTSGFNAAASLVFAAEIATDTGTLDDSVNTWILEPGLSRSTGFGQSRAPFSRPNRCPRRPPRPVDHALTAQLVDGRTMQSTPQPLVHSAKRRSAVDAVNRTTVADITRHKPLVRVNTTAVNTARSSTGAVPPPYGRESETR